DIARLTRGAYCRFDPGAARQLAELLRAVAVYAVGGVSVLAHRRDAGAIKLLDQLSSRPGRTRFQKDLSWVVTMNAITTATRSLAHTSDCAAVAAVAAVR